MKKELTYSQMYIALVRNFHGAIQHPATAKALCFCKTLWPGFHGDLMREIHLHNGDWRQTVKDLLANRNGCSTLPGERIKAFAAWAEKITSRPVRGLLEWKGAAR